MLQQILIILPGWDGSHETWAGFAALAKDEFQEVKVIDLPCFGDEPCPDAVWGVGDYAQFLKQQINKLTNKPITLLGHSFGGIVATRLAAENPELINKLILSGASILRPNRILHRLFFKCLAKCGKFIFSLPVINNFSALAKKILYRAAGSADYLRASGIKREIFKKIIGEDQSDLLPKIKLPVLVVWGSQDKFIPLSFGRKINALLSDSKLVIFQGGKHGLHLQQPDELLKKITEFAAD